MSTYLKNKEEKIQKKILQAIYDFQMLCPNETILLAVSWGKDSMFLWYFLKKISYFLPYPITIQGIYIYKNFLINCDIAFEEKKQYFEKELSIPLEKIDISDHVSEKLKQWLGKSCQRCSYARRISLMKLCQKYNATKIAYGHHMDDIVTTTFMNMLTWKQLKIMPPINKMRKGNITFIRPLCYLREKDILEFVQRKNIPFSPCNCPIGEQWMRKRIKHMLLQNEHVFPWFIENIFFSLIKDFKNKYESTQYII